MRTLRIYGNWIGQQTVVTGATPASQDLFGFCVAMIENVVLPPGKDGLVGCHKSRHTIRQKLMVLKAIDSARVYANSLKYVGLLSMIRYSEEEAALTSPFHMMIPSSERQYCRGVSRSQKAPTLRAFLFGETEQKAINVYLKKLRTLLKKPYALAFLSSVDCAPVHLPLSQVMPARLFPKPESVPAQGIQSTALSSKETAAHA
uniref:PX domain-containing protein n=1 Tax=Panagrellus redivivus TaxID=6233 RepID=A0A7E4ZRX5_PANRE